MNLDQYTLEERVLRWTRNNLNGTEMMIALFIGLALTSPIWGPWLMMKKVGDRMRYHRDKRNK